MVMTPRTGEFHKIKEDLDKLAASSDSFGPEDVQRYLDEKGVDSEEFASAWQEFADAGFEADSPGLTVGRITGRVVGETADIALDLGKLITPEYVEDLIGGWAERAGEHIPDDVKRTAAELFDPYHGDGWLEPLVGDVAPFLVPYTGALKGYKWAKMGLRRARGIKSTRPHLKLPHKDHTGKVIRTPEKIQGWAKKQRPKKKLEALAREGFAAGTGMTLLLGPDEDILTGLIEEYGDSHPDLIKYIDRLAIDPHDSEAKQWFDAFRNNVILEGPFAAIGGIATFGAPYVGKTARRMKLGETVLQKTGMSNLAKWSKKKMKENLTSRYGVDDTTLAMALRRMYAGNKAVSEADGIAQDLKRTVKRERKAANKLTDEPIDEKELLELMNRGLGGDRPETQAAALETLRSIGFNDTADGLVRMRGMVDDFSRAIIDSENGLVSGELQATIDSQLGLYLNRAYRLFDDPSFENWDELKNMDGGMRRIENALNYIKRQGATEDQADYILKKILGKRDKKLQNESLKILSDSALKSSKPFYGRSNLPWEIKELIGEIKDPYKNFGRTYEKLAVAKAEADYLHGLRSHLLANGLAKETTRGPRVSMAPSRLESPLPSPNTTKEEAMDSLKDISNERLTRILGKKALDPENYQAQNPLEDLVANESYQKFIREGTELFSPAGTLGRAFLLSKVGTQTAKTVLSPATHGRNIMGNLILLGANGYNPLTFGREHGALDIVTNRLRGYSDEKLGKYVGRLQELGIMDSSVKAQTVKKIASEAFNYDPNSHIGRLNKSGVGVATRKIFEAYQAEDDLFKIVHFQKTLDDMRKWNLGVSDDVLEEMAAVRTRDLMPNYALVPKTVKWLRRSPLSDFAAWPAELTRVSKNLVKYSYQDASGKTAARLRREGFDIDDKAAEAIRDQGYRRTAGLITASLMGDALANWSMQWQGLDQEDVYNINRLAPPWEQNTSKIFLSGIDEDKSGHIGVDYINLGPIDPFSYLKAPAKMVMAALKADRDIPHTDMLALGVAAYDNVVGPFLGASMATELGMQLATGALTREGQEEAIKDIPGFALESGKSILKAFEPGAYTLAKKQLQYQNRKKQAALQGRGVMSEFGYSMSPKEFTGLGAFTRWLGIRPQRLDISAGVRRNLLPLVKEIENAPAKFTSEASNPAGRTQEELAHTYADSIQKQLNNYKRLKSITDTYDSLLNDNNITYNPAVKSHTDGLDVIIGGATKDYTTRLMPNLLQYMDYARQNEFVPFYPTKQADLGTDRSGNVIPWEQIDQLYDALLNTTIND